MAHSKEEILVSLTEIITETTHVKAENVGLQKSFDELDIDSLSLVEISVAIEEKFGVTVPDDAIKDLVTVGDAVDFISRQA